MHSDAAVGIIRSCSHELLLHAQRHSTRSTTHRGALVHSDVVIQSQTSAHTRQQDDDDATRRALATAKRPTSSVSVTYHCADESWLVRASGKERERMHVQRLDQQYQHV